MGTNTNTNTNTSVDFVAVMVEDNVATLDKISKSPIGKKVVPVVASWGYNSNEQLADVFLAKTTRHRVCGTNDDGNNFNEYIVLPLLKESSQLEACKTAATAREFARRGKKKDASGSSLASVLRTPFDAGVLLAQHDGEKMDDDDPYDFSSESSIVESYFQ